ncbi:antibiotic biosynthesis monooxygenase family protein [Amycolatopsis japonica]|uniref:antibiotic biosynthesis monooxygenase family protein n=1 Tax=Amycolatopsis japonica TaxID=208439 RepID=UPI00366FBED9
MFIATNRLFVPSGSADAFEALFRENMRTYLPGVKGLRRSTLLRPVTEDAPYVSVNDFDSEEAFREWIASDSFKQAHDRNRKLVRHVTGNAVETFHVSEEITLA